MKIESLIKYNKTHLMLSKLMYKLHFYDAGRLFSKKRIEKSVKYLKAQIPETLSKNYSNSGKKKLSVKEQPVFLMWFQGEKAMPVIVKKCFESVCKHFGERKVILLTAENLFEYVTLPEFITKKINEGKISITSASDIYRAAILKKYGGTWVDATAFISDDFDDSYFQRDFYCPCGFESEKKKDWKYIFKDSKGWTIWFMGSDLINYSLFDFLYNAYTEYFSKNDFSVDYFLTDMLISIFYEANEEFAKNLNEIENNNSIPYELFGKLLQNKSEKVADEVNSILKQCKIHKFTYKKNLDFDGKTNNFSNTFIRNY